MENSNKPTPEIHFVRINSSNVSDVCELSDTLTIAQRKMVADNAKSIAQAHCSENSWMRAIYADKIPVGFILMHYGSDFEDGIDCPGAFLWRFMIALPFQGKGYGKKAMERLITELRAKGYQELYTSCGLGEASPEGFYKGFGFVPTGDFYDDEIELVLKFQR
jgi:diamine N-acetyltransferase